MEKDFETVMAKIDRLYDNPGMQEIGIFTWVLVVAGSLVLGLAVVELVSVQPGSALLLTVLAVVLHVPFIRRVLGRRRARRQIAELRHELFGDSSEHMAGLFVRGTGLDTWDF